MLLTVLFASPLLLAPALLAPPALPGPRTLAGPAPRPGAAEGNGSSAAALCPTSGTPVLGLDWTCISTLDLAEVVLMLVGLVIIWYIYRASEHAELPGESAEVPVTAEEQAAYLASRAERARSPRSVPAVTDGEADEDAAERGTPSEVPPSEAP